MQSYDWRIKKNEARKERWCPRRYVSKLSSATEVADHLICGITVLRKHRFVLQTIHKRWKGADFVHLLLSRIGESSAPGVLSFLPFQDCAYLGYTCMVTFCGEERWALGVTSPGSPCLQLRIGGEAMGSGEISQSSLWAGARGRWSWMIRSRSEEAFFIRLLKDN